MAIPFQYLGMIVGGMLKRQCFWNEVVTKIKNKLTKWKG